MLAKRVFGTTRRRTGLALSAALCLAAGLPGAASATTYLLTFTGVVGTGGSSIDGYGIFGAAGGDLSGYGYTEVFTINIPTPGAQVYTGFDGLPAGIEGIYEASPATASLTINNITFAFPQVISANYARHTEGNPVDDQRNDVLRATVGGRGNNVLNGGLWAETGGPGSFFNSGEFVAPLDLDLEFSSFQWGTVHFAYYGADGYSSDRRTNLVMEATHVTFAEQAAVPEPATWAMFIGGFGLIGCTLRRRQQVRASTPAG